MSSSMLNLSVIIIDDSKFLSNALKQSFTNRGFRVTQAFDISSAKALLQENEYDYALLDLELPDGKGEDLLPYLQICEETRVVVLTGSRDSERRKEIFQFGVVVDYIVKERYFADMEYAIFKLIEIISTNNDLHILIVDDSNFMRTHLKILLSKRNFQVHTCISGKEALKTLKKIKIDAVIVDLEMPVMNGTQLIGAIKRDKKNLHLPVMVVSGTSDLNKVAKVLKNGANDFIKKPFSDEELLLKVDKMMQDLKQQRLIRSQQEELKTLNDSLEISRNEALDLAKEKTELLSTMSHEIRVPLNAIQGFIRALKKDETDEKKKQYLNIIDKSSNNLTDIINDILDISKIESGNFVLDITTFNLRDEMKHIYDLFEQNASNRDVTLINSISTTLPLNVKSDILRIRQIISNLLSNAIKFTDEGKSVELSVAYDKENSLLKCSVRDEGIGISPENIEKITQAYKQAEASTAREYGGTGLGLSIVTKMLSLLDSQLHIESKEGQGSVFSCSIPIEVVAQTVQTSVSSKNAQKILVAEDHKTNQILLEMLIQEMHKDIEIVFANDGIEAEALFKQDNFNLVFMDINMPNKDGIQTLKDIKRIEKNKRKTTPVVALSGNILNSNCEEFLSLGFDACLSKPYNEHEIKAILKKYF